MSGYNGPADIIAGELVIPVRVRLTGHVQRIPTPDAAGGPTQHIEGQRSWQGYADGLDDHVFELLGETVTVRTPDGREGDAIVQNNAGHLVGSGPAPFDL